MDASSEWRRPVGMHPDPDRVAVLELERWAVAEDGVLVGVVRKAAGRVVAGLAGARCRARVDRVWGLPGPWDRGSLSEALDGAAALRLRVRGRDGSGVLLAEVA